MERYYQTADVAQRAGVTPGLVRRHAAEGRLETAAITERGTRLFTAEAVQSYLEERRSRRDAREDVRR